MSNMGLMEWVLVDTELDLAIPPSSIIYSRKPRVGYAANGKRYYFKGPDLEVVFAEAAAYALADTVGLNVPRASLAHVPPVNDIHFASEALPINSAVTAFLDAGKTSNPGFLADCIAFDIWIANTDRNTLNIVAEPQSGSRLGNVELYAIDFEKSEILTGRDFLTVGSMPSRKFWPVGDLSRHALDLPFPEQMCARIADLKPDQLFRIREQLDFDMLVPADSWTEGAFLQLASRSKSITSLVREAWNG